MTSRELADLIDELIQVRIMHSELILSDQWDRVERARERIEVLKRKLADALKRLDHNPGVYFDGPEKK